MFVPLVWTVALLVWTHKWPSPVPVLPAGVWVGGWTGVMLGVCVQVNEYVRVWMDGCVGGWVCGRLGVCVGGWVYGCMGV